MAPASPVPSDPPVAPPAPALQRQLQPVGLADPFRWLAAGARDLRLVGIGSVAGIRGLPGHAAYCASKAAAISYCESLRGELNPLGFKVVTLAPGYIKTPLTQKNKFPMPFLMTADAFADQALKAIERGTSFQVIPWQMAWVARLLRILPDALLDRALKNQPRKHRAP